MTVAVVPKNAPARNPSENVLSGMVYKKNYFSNLNWTSAAAKANKGLIFQIAREEMPAFCAHDTCDGLVIIFFWRC